MLKIVTIRIKSKPEFLFEQREYSINERMGHTAVSATQASSVTL